MSRSGYNDDGYDVIPLGLYRHSVDLAIKGKRGQRFLREMAEAMDAMPVRRLISETIVDIDGECCALGTVFQSRNILVDCVDEPHMDEVAEEVGIATSLAAEIAYANDDCGPYDETPEARWMRMRAWVQQHLTHEKMKEEIKKC